MNSIPLSHQLAAQPTQTVSSQDPDRRPSLAAAPAQRILIAVCTLNEAENVGPMIERLRDVLPQADVLIVDDNSPDGTPEIARKFASVDAQVHVEVRHQRGLGGAIRHAMSYAIDHQYDWFLNLDGDFSHSPSDLARMMEVAVGPGRPDLVVGSRYANGGKIVGWPAHRRWMSRLVNGFATRILRLPVSDCSGSMRCYRVDVLREANVETLVSNGYSVLEEILVRISRMDVRFAEVPITFTERTAGNSKLTARTAIEAGLQMIRLAFR